VYGDGDDYGDVDVDRECYGYGDGNGDDVSHPSRRTKVSRHSHGKE
jgi:hypothetical protein